MLKSAKHKSKHLGKQVTITQLPAIGLEEIMDLENDRHGLRAAAVTCRYCVDEWADRTLDDILRTETADTIYELAEAVAALNGPRAKKNSANGQRAALSSGSH
jgi:hypothetical protein